MNMFRFPTKLSVVLVTVGSLAAIGGVGLALKIFLEPGGGWVRIGGALAVAVAGLLVIACAEIVGVVFALEEEIHSIEDHTRRTHDLLERYLTRVEKTSETKAKLRAGSV